MNLRAAVPIGRSSMGFIISLVMLSASGCASIGGLGTDGPRLPPVASAWDMEITPADAWLRYYLNEGKQSEGIEAIAQQRHGSSDVLLDALQRALLLREQGEFGLSNESFELAESEMERRATMSLSRTAGAYLVTEGLLDYRLSATESVLLPLYRMFNFLDLDDLPAAAVEARRVEQRIDLLGEEKGRCSIRGTAGYLTGNVFESTGEIDDAVVAYRRAELALRDCPDSAMPEGLPVRLMGLANRTGFSELADTLAERYGPSPDIPEGGQLLLVIERGYVAHRVSEALVLPLLDDDLKRLNQDDDSERFSLVADDLVARYSQDHGWESRSPRNRRRGGWDYADGHLLKLAWPALWEPREQSTSTDFAIQWKGDSIDALRLMDLTTLARMDLQEQAPGIMLRTVTRGLTRYVVANDLERRAENEGGELLGFLTSRLVNAVGNQLEQADTRSWSLLPRELALATVDVPDGDVSLDLSISTGTGSTRQIRVGPLKILAGETRIVPLRILPGEAPVTAGNGVLAAVSE